MTPLVPTKLWAIAAGAAVAVGGLLAGWNARLGLSVFAGAAWNLANLWCLIRLLGYWLNQPAGRDASRRRAIGWLIVKFPVLYVIVFAILRHPAVSLLGFGLGFTLVLIAAIAVLAWQAQRTFAPRA